MTDTLAQIKQLALRCLDLTSLNDTDTEDDIRILCQRAITSQGNVAAICINPELVNFAKRTLTEPRIHVATVANFPGGDLPIEQIMSDIKQNLLDGADEIDLVFPYTAYLLGDKITALEVITAAKKICAEVTLKVILETGAFNDPQIIALAAHDCLAAGADFLKTSTGKIAIGATIEAATILLQTIKNYQPHTNRILGFKVSGGVRTVNDAVRYINLAEVIMGSHWVTPQTFRIGASSLLAALTE